MTRCTAWPAALALFCPVPAPGAHQAVWLIDPEGAYDALADENRATMSAARPHYEIGALVRHLLCLRRMYSDRAITLLCRAHAGLPTAEQLAEDA